MLRLTEKRFFDFFSEAPETGMTYVVVTAVLKDGRKFEQVVVIGGLDVAMVRGYAQVPFTESEIDHSIVTHEKWDWSYT